MNSSNENSVDFHHLKSQLEEYINFYEENGYLVIPDWWTPSTCLHLKQRMDSVLTLSVGERGVNSLDWFIDGAHQVHCDLCGHIRAMMTLGKGEIHDASVKKKMNMRSGTETELVGGHDVTPQALQTGHFSEAQGCNTKCRLQQDNESCMKKMHLEVSMHLFGDYGSFY